MGLLVLKEGDVRPEVKLLHQLLNEKVIPSPMLDTNDDFFGPDTFKAVVQFQTQHALKPDGKVGTQTWTALDQPLPTSGKISAGPKITYGENAKVPVSENGIRVLKDILIAAGEESCLITSTLRTPYDQARVMYDNAKSTGVQQQYDLYGSTGDKVIKVFEENKTKPRDAVIALMEAKIIAVKYGETDGHRVHGKERDVFDVAPSSIKSDQKFHKAIKANKEVYIYHAAKVVGGSDPAFHLEIKYPATKDPAPLWNGE